MLYHPKLWTPTNRKALLCAVCGKPYSLGRQLLRPMLGLGAVHNLGPCACCGGGGDPVLFEFCGCEVRSVSLSLNGGNAIDFKRALVDGGCPDHEVESTSVTHNGVNGGGCRLIVGGIEGTGTVTYEFNCNYSNLNGSYNTTNASLGGGGNVSATFLLGEFHDDDDRGIEIGHLKSETWTRNISPCGAFLFESLDRWFYVWEIALTIACTSSGCDSGKSRLAWTWVASTQAWTRCRKWSQGTGALICDNEGWDHLPCGCGDRNPLPCDSIGGCHLSGSGSGDCQDPCVNYGEDDFEATCCAETDLSISSSVSLQ
jgi:hypothetical protein